MSTTAPAQPRRLIITRGKGAGTHCELIQTKRGNVEVKLPGGAKQWVRIENVEPVNPTKPKPSVGRPVKPKPAVKVKTKTPLPRPATLPDKPADVTGYTSTRRLTKFARSIIRNYLEAVWGQILEREDDLEGLAAHLSDIYGDFLEIDHVTPTQVDSIIRSMGRTLPKFPKTELERCQAKLKLLAGYEIETRQRIDELIDSLGGGVPRLGLPLELKRMVKQTHH